MFTALLIAAVIVVAIFIALVSTLIHLDNRVTPATKRLRIAAAETRKQNLYNDTYATFGNITYRRDGGDMPSKFTPVK